MVIEINQTISHYKILRKLGAGGMGEVYLAEDMDLRRKVALKFLPPQLTSDPELKARFRREAQAAAALNHPNIITIHEISEYRNTSFIAMEYVEGESLREVIVREKLPVGKALEIVIQICEGLREAHRAGIIHRDIKPPNILINHDDRVKIADFGIAKLQGATQLTEEGVAIGTPHYMSPEQAKGEKLDQRSDIFSVGVVLYELITHHLPFQGDNQPVVLYAITYTTPPPLAQYAPGTPEGLQRLVDKALEKARDTRYQQIDNLLADLKREEKLLSRPPKSTADVPPPKEKKTPSRRNILIALAAVFALLLVMFAIYLSSQFDAGSTNTPVTSDVVPLSIATTPGGASVFLNRDSIGVTPLNFSSSVSGMIKIHLQKPDYFPIDTSFVIRTGRDSTFSFALQPAARVSIKVTPPQAKVLLDGKMIPLSRLANITLSVGPHRISISAEGYASKENQFSLRQGINPTLTYSLDRIAASTLPQPTVGSIQITSVPSGASVWLDGRQIGITPYENNVLQPGNYQLSVRKDGYEDYSQTIIAGSDQKTTVVANLVALMGNLNITSEPAGASILLDGKPEGSTPGTIQKKAGTYQIVLRKPGYRDYSTSVTIERGKVQPVAAKLTALVGVLKVLVNPFGSIYIDGKLYKENADRQFKTDLSAGTYQLKAVHPSFGAWEKSVNIAPDATLDITIDFNKMARLTITSTPELGEIFVDKISKGYAPKQLTLRVGQHTIEVRREGYAGETKIINLEGDVNEPLTFTLKKIQ